MTTTDLAAVRQARQWASNGAAKSIRLAAGLSLREVAGALDVSASTVYRWESGRRRPRAEAAEKYGALLARLMDQR